jgi:PEP-CTERM motif
MARCFCFVVGLIAGLVLFPQLAVAAQFTTTVASFIPSDAGDRLVADYDFGFAFSHVESLEFEFEMPAGYEGYFATTGNSSWSRTMHVVLHDETDAIDLTEIGLGMPITSLSSTVVHVVPGAPAGFKFVTLLGPGETPAFDFDEFVLSGHGRITVVDSMRSDIHPLPDHVSSSSKTSYSLPHEISSARITITGTAVPEPAALSMMLLGVCSLVGGLKHRSQT